MKNAPAIEATGTLVRSWNLFHGRSHPPGEVDYVEDAVRIASGDEPDVLCLQEVPPWALEHLEQWTGMQSFGDIVRRPSLGPVSLTPALGRRLTGLGPRVLRSAFSGQANAILVRAELHPIEHRSRCLNPRGRRSLRSARGERRCCQTLSVTLPDARPALVANLHASPHQSSPARAEAELMRALSWIDELAGPEDVIVLAGDFNLSAQGSDIFATLIERGFSAPGAGIDHVLVRGAIASPVVSWASERRSRGGALLSDHAPVELTIAAA
jgi:endonuclease/exonuclease/phosphatase family metal-dependent hydrolase